MIECPFMPLIVGIAGAARNAAAAISVRQDIVAVCEQERVTRTRRDAPRPGRLPAQAVAAALAAAGRTADEISRYAVAEPEIELPAGLAVDRIDHHRAHAATSFFSSAFPEAVVIVCDRHGSPELTIWQGSGSHLHKLDFAWQGPALASLYSRATRAVGLAPDADEHRLEALALVADRPAPIPEALVALRAGGFDVQDGFEATIADTVRAGGSGRIMDTARVARGVQQVLGQRLVEIAQQVKRQFGGTRLCVGGGLFFNAWFNTVLAQSGVYDETFVPVNPGNAGVAVGAALSARPDGHVARDAPLSAFLGPGFESHEIKATLDNCKLSYDYAGDDACVERAARALAEGRLVGWFQGRMEWGPRALGHRSIIASPIAPFALDNLNLFLKHREPHRPYSVSVCSDDLPRFFDGPPASRFMEFEYHVREPERFRAVLPLGATSVRVQTVPPEARAFHRLIKAFGDLSGVPVVVNTSFNGFNEPIVCSPRDAVRVFFGTGLDVAVLGNFILRK
jgi:carbamoyltransferase